MAPSTLIDALRDPDCYPHPVGRVELVETHISWVLLAGEFAYKLRKPVDFGFLDFSTPAARLHDCDEELRLNRRLAPQLYLGVVPITGSTTAPRVGGNGPAIEHAVRMRRFRREDELDALAERDALLPSHLDDLAATIARFHAQAAVAGQTSPWGRPDDVLAHCLENFAHVRPALDDPADRAALDTLEGWTRTEHARRSALMAARRTQGFVRECHGDLHLANMVLIDGRVVVFDAIEFNPGLRWTDTIAEIAFTAMDLRARGLAALARRFVDAWLAHSGDHGGLPLLRYFVVYRAMVRAKVAALRALQAGAAERAPWVAQIGARLALARELLRVPPPMLVTTCGVSGSGKSRLAQRLLEADDWVRLRSDVERGRIAALAPDLRGGNGGTEGIASRYGADATRRTYDRLAGLARELLADGQRVIVDATCQSRWQRDLFRALARERGVPFVLLCLDAPPALLRARVAARAAEGNDPSEATVAVLEAQLARAEPIADDERAVALMVDAAGDPPLAPLRARLDATEPEPA